MNGDLMSTKSAIASSALSSASGGSGWGQAGLGVDHSPPAGGQVQILEQHRRLSRDEIGQRGVELGTAALAGNAHRPVITRGAVIDLDHVGQGNDPGRQQQVLALRAVRAPFPVPALEGLADRVADLLAQSQAPRERVSGVPVVGKHAVDVTVTARHKTHPHPRPREQRATRAQMARHVLQRRGPGGVDEPEVALKSEVITEPLRLLIGVDMAAHPDNQRGVIKTRTGSLVEAKQLPEPQRNQALPQDVLHRLVHAQVSAQRQDGQQLGETDAFGGRRDVRHASIIAGTARQRTPPHPGRHSAPSPAKPRLARIPPEGHRDPALGILKRGLLRLRDARPMRA